MARTPDYEKLEKQANEKLAKLQLLKRQIEELRAQYLRESGVLAPEEGKEKKVRTPDGFETSKAILEVLSLSTKRLKVVEVLSDIEKKYGVTLEKDAVKAMLNYLANNKKIMKIIEKNGEKNSVFYQAIEPTL
jgi:phosphomannomutase